jgi:carboxylesterase type B
LITKIFTNLLYGGTSLTVFPLVEDKIVFSDSIESLISKNGFKKCNIITGFDKNEMGYFLVKFGFLGSNFSQWNDSTQTMTYERVNEITNTILHYYPSYPLLTSQETINSILARYITTTQIQSTYYPAVDRIGSDIIFICPTFAMGEMYSGQKNKVYMYEYGYRIPTTIYPASIGVVHGDELPTLFAEALSNKVKINLRIIQL